MSPADISGVSNQSSSSSFHCVPKVNTNNVLFQKYVIIKAESALSYLGLSVTIRGIHDP